MNVLEANFELLLQTFDFFSVFGKEILHSGASLGISLQAGKYDKFTASGENLLERIHICIENNLGQSL